MEHLLVAPIVCLCLTACGGGDGAVSAAVSASDASDAQQLAALSTEEISCPVDDMVITDHGWEADGLTRKWTVDCDGGHYVCEDQPLSADVSQTTCTLNSWS